MTRASLLVLSACALACAPSPLGDVDASFDAPLADASLEDGSIDAAAPEVRCATGVGPHLVVTADDALFGSASSLARLPIQVTGPVTGMTILGVEQALAGTAVGSVRAPA